MSQKIVWGKAHEALTMVIGKIKMIFNELNLDCESIGNLENVLVVDFSDLVNVAQEYQNSQPERERRVTYSTRWLGSGIRSDVNFREFMET